MSIISESSGSLIIAEGNNQFEINSSDSKAKRQDDLFQLSRDDLTLSFQIEQQQYQAVMQMSKNIPQNNFIPKSQEPVREEHKKKRKEIFQKFKRPPSTICVKQEHTVSESNLLSIFDSIFKTKNSNSPQKSARQNKIEEISIKPFLLASEHKKTPSQQKRERLKIFGKKKFNSQTEGILPPQLLVNQSTILQKQPLILEDNFQGQKKEEMFNFEESLSNFQEIQIQKRFTLDRDSFDLQAMLQTQIFKEENIAFNESKFEKKQQNQQITDIKHIQSPAKGMTIQSFSKTKNHIINNIEQIKIEQPAKQNTVPLVLQTINRVHNPTIEQQQILVVNQIQESNYLSVNTSNISSPSMCVQNYENQMLSRFAPQNSMVNAKTLVIEQASIIKETLPSNNQLVNRLVESQIIQCQPPTVIVNIFEQQDRLPIFLRKIRQHLSIYPNFYIMVNSPNTMESIKEQFYSLFQLFKVAICFMNEACQWVLYQKLKKQQYMSQLIKKMTYDYFINFDWEMGNSFDRQQLIRPKEPIQIREWSHEKAKTGLANYQKIINYYQGKGIALDLTTDKGRKKYFQIRQKFWDIAGNMKLISEDIFCELRDCSYPFYYYQFKSFLKQAFPTRINEQNLNKTRKILNLYRHLKLEKDLLINSEIGTKIKQKLDLYMKYLGAF